MTTAEQVHTLWKDMRYYMTWWLFFGALAGLFTPVTSTAFWSTKGVQVLRGLFFGAVCGLVFTLLQNTFNRSRNKHASWGIAIATWMGMRFVFRALM
jgi:hypothetical protein